VTFRLADSLPQLKLRELESLKQAWLREAGGPSADCRSTLANTLDELTRKVMQHVEDWLDQGMGECWLKRPELRQIVVDALHHFDGVRYELGCYVIMPNHVHLVMLPLCPQEHPLETLLQGRKIHTSLEINTKLARTGAVWQEESFDRIIRDEEHLWRCIQYIGRNPERAHLTAGEWVRWIRPSWQECGYGFEK
jgi:hypothetical protein